MAGMSDIFGHAFAVCLVPSMDLTSPSLPALDIDGLTTISRLMLKWSWAKDYEYTDEDWYVVESADHFESWGEPTHYKGECFEGSWARAELIAPSLLDGTYEVKFRLKEKNEH